MRIVACWILVVLVSSQSFSQKPPIKFGEIPMSDMEMTFYEKDSSASAVVLADYGKCDRTSFERIVRIKILNKDGLQSWADVTIPLIGFGSQKLLDLKASTFNLESGKIVEYKMSGEGVFNEDLTANVQLGKFTLPNVKTGSVIEYSYRLTGAGVPNWEFQRSIPVRWSEYLVIVPEHIKFEIYMQGYVPVNTYEVKDKEMAGYHAKTYHWISKNVPAFKEEPFMTSERDYISKINFALSYIDFPGMAPIEIMSSWTKLNNDLLKDDEFGAIIFRSNDMKVEVDRITAGITDPMKKIEAIHHYVRQTMEWNGRNRLLAVNFKKAIGDKKGTSADINFMLATMLNKAGFLVDMALLSTREHGFVRPQYPTIQQFDYAICVARVDGKPILLDATEKFLPYTILPMRCLNGQALMISSITPDWIDILPKAKARTIVDANLALDSLGTLNGKLQFTFEGYDALTMRKEYDAKGETEYTKSFFHALDWRIEKSEFQNIKELSQPVKVIHEVSIGERTSVSGDIVYLSPFVHSRVETNPFRSEAREFPVDFGCPVEKMVMIKITLPEGYVVDELPQSKIFKLSGNSAKYTYNATQAGNLVSVTSNMQINKTLFTQDEYPDLREFYNQVIAKQAELIVLKKK